VYLAAAGGKPPGFDSGLQSSGQFSLEVTNDQERMQKIFVLSLLLSFIDLQIRTQPSGSSANSISIAAKEWSGEWLHSSCHLSLEFLLLPKNGFDSPSAINSAPTGEETYDAYLAAAKALGSNQNTVF
jgi:hypothetical protein